MLNFTYTAWEIQDLKASFGRENLDQEEESQRNEVIKKYTPFTVEVQEPLLGLGVNTTKSITILLISLWNKFLYNPLSLDLFYFEWKSLIQVT